MEKQTVRGIYEDGEVRLTEPVHRTGTWQVEIAFTTQIDDGTAPAEANPHRPEAGQRFDHLDEFQRQVDDRHTRPVI